MSDKLCKCVCSVWMQEYYHLRHSLDLHTLRTCVALSAVKEEPHLGLGQMLSEEPFGYSRGFHLPASSALTRSQ